MAWITNEVEDDRDKLEEMFWPTKNERQQFHCRNKEARKWQRENEKRNSSVSSFSSSINETGTYRSTSVASAEFAMRKDIS